MARVPAPVSPAEDAAIRAGGFRDADQLTGQGGLLAKFGAARWASGPR